MRELNQKFSYQFGEEKIYVKPFITNPDSTNVYLLDFSGLRGKEYNNKPMDKGLDVAEWLLEEALIGTVPGECFFFDEKEMLLRVALNHTSREFEMAFDSAIEAVKKIQNITPIGSKFEPNSIIPTTSVLSQSFNKVDEETKTNSAEKIA